MFKNAFSFNERIGRKEYLVSLLGFIISLLFSRIFFAFDNIMLQIVGLAICAIAFWFWIAQRTKRCHDRSVSGLWQLLPYYEFVLLLAESDPGENTYGRNPKGTALVDDWDPIANENKDIIDEKGRIIN